jgi:hypothetical protein
MDGVLGEELIPAILRLLGDYGRLIDGREAVAWGRLFGDEGTLAVGEREITGAAELTEFAAQSAEGVHVQSVPSLEPRPDGTVYAESSFVFVNAATGKLTAGSYRDELAPDGDTFFFVRRDISIRVRT